MPVHCPTSRNSHDLPRPHVMVVDSTVVYIRQKMVDSTERVDSAMVYLCNGFMLVSFLLCVDQNNVMHTLIHYLLPRSTTLSAALRSDIMHGSQI